MLTEQEVLNYINKGLKENNLKPESQKYTSRLLTVDGLIKENSNKIKELETEMRKADQEDLRLRGALSMLIELVAETEGLLDAQPVQNPESNKSE